MPQTSPQPGAEAGHNSAAQRHATPSQRNAMSLTELAAHLRVAAAFGESDNQPSQPSISPLCDRMRMVRVQRPRFGEAAKGTTLETRIMPPPVDRCCPAVHDEMPLRQAVFIDFAHTSLTASASLKDLIQALQPGELHARAVRRPLPAGLQEHAHGWEQHLHTRRAALCRRPPLPRLSRGIMQ